MCGCGYSCLLVCTHGCEWDIPTCRHLKRKKKGSEKALTLGPEGAHAIRAHIAGRRVRDVEETVVLSGPFTQAFEVGVTAAQPSPVCERLLHHQATAALSNGIVQSQPKRRHG